MGSGLGLGLGLGLSLLPPAPAEAAGLTRLSSFEGTTQLLNCQLAQCFRPPDTMGAIGPSQFVETTNGSISVYDRSSGAVLQRWPMKGAGSFWTSKLGGAFTGSAGDQRILFDLYTNRWIVIGFGSATSDVNIAISDSSDALGSWKGTVFTGFAGGIADYPTLGIDAQAVYIGTNNFQLNAGTPPSYSYSGASLFAIPRADLFSPSGGIPTAANRATFNSPFGSTLPNGLFTLQGVVDWWGGADGKAAVLAVDASRAGRLYAMDVQGLQGATPGFSSPQAVTTHPSDLDNQPGRQPDGTRLVDTLDDRISANVYEANGKIYGAQTVTVAGHDYTQVRWFVVDAISKAMVEEGLIGGDPFDYYQPAIAVNAMGDAVISYNRSGGVATGIDGRISIMAQGFVSDALGGLDPYGESLLLRRSEVNDYRCGPRTSIDTSCRQRWGDYAAVSIDPADPRRFWLIGEYAAEWAVMPSTGVSEPSANWSTFIASVQLERVAVPGPLPLLGAAGAWGWARRLRRRVGCRRP